MKRVFLPVLVVGTLMLAAPSPAGAIVDLGELCFAVELVGNDTIRAAAQLSANIITLNFRWRTSSNLYQIFGTGTASEISIKSAPQFQPGDLRMVLIGVSDNPIFNGNSLCTLSVAIGPPNYAGLGTFVCSGGGGDSIDNAPSVFKTKIPVTLVACTPAM